LEQQRTSIGTHGRWIARSRLTHSGHSIGVEIVRIVFIGRSFLIKKAIAAPAASTRNDSAVITGIGGG
jgi:hypothetical protein